MSPDIPLDKWVHRCSDCEELSVGHKSILELVSKSNTKPFPHLQNLCKRCSQERTDEHNFKKQQS